jgi:16S rRNA G966 N2-methylase RsmD
MTPYYDHAGIAIYHGDCREILPTLPKVDLVLTDPPYGAVTHDGARSSKNVNIASVTFAPLTSDELCSLAASFVEASRRWVVMTCEWRHAVQLEKETKALVRLGVWVKPNGAPQFTGDRPGTGWEAVAILHREGKKFWNGGGHHAVWHCPIEQGEHPTQKPLRLIHRWITDFSVPAETILDPFMGSGTTLVAAKQLGRKAIGIEIEERYCEIAAKRLSQEMLPIFEAPAPQPEQLTIA